jgi:thiamine kinase-like enzyme
MQKLDTQQFGNSGCEITKTEDWVTKKSASLEYNKRFILQIAKQAVYTGNFLTPKIENVYAEKDGLIAAVMENCGNPVAMMAHEAPILEKMLTMHLSRKFGKADFRAQILQKFQEVSSKLEDQIFAQKVKRRAEKEIYILPVGYCHGDLTLTNILCKDGEFYLIDFLEDWIPSPAFDMCKILQDCHYRWYTVTGEPFKEWHKKLGEKVFLDYIATHGIDHICGVMLLTLYRILPYCEKTPRGQFIKDLICKEFL